jgi:hypothetical protein
MSRSCGSTIHAVSGREISDGVSAMLGRPKARCCSNRQQ